MVRLKIEHYQKNKESCKILFARLSEGLILSNKKWFYNFFVFVVPFVVKENCVAAIIKNMAKRVSGEKL